MKDVDIRIESVGDMEAKIDLDTQDLLLLYFYPEIVIEAKAFDWPVEAQLLDAKVSALGQLAQDAMQTAGASGALASEAIQEAQSAVQEASGALIQSKEYTDQELAKIKPKSIEVVLTENSAMMDIDLTELDIKNGNSFELLLQTEWVNSQNELSTAEARPCIRLNNISTVSYIWSSNIYNHLQPWASNGIFKLDRMNFKLINNVLFYYTIYAYRIITDGSRYTLTTNNGGYIIDNQITNINSIKIIQPGTNVKMKAGSFAKITKL
ncbi:MAG: hypothetical protein GX587_15455 [Bacteroidales bacterium]|nr:hypothetical protein [Bacteroidales bacterium]